MTTLTLRDVCRQLAEEPLFALSRASKELFHTNLLGWIAEHRPDVFIEAFRPWLTPAEGPAEVIVRREWKHLDLVVELPGFAPLVVEAKVFSLPDEDQLTRYSDLPSVRMLGSDATAILLTLDLPTWTSHTFGDSGMRWTAVRLDAIASAFEAAAGGDPFENGMIQHEGALLRLLVQLQEACALGTGSDRFFMAPLDRALLSDYRLDLSVQKARASRFRSMVAARLLDSGVVAPTHELWAGASHGEAVTSALWSDGKGDGVGWQVQGGRWSLALLNQSRSARDGHPREERFATAARNEHWFEFTPAWTILATEAGRVQPEEGFNRYDPDFVYRAITLPTDVSVESMLELAEHYSRIASTFSMQ